MSDDRFDLELKFIKPRNKAAKPNELIKPINFIAVKGVSALGNQLSRYSINKISIVENKNHKETEEKNNIDSTFQADDVDSQIKINF